LEFDVQATADGVPVVLASDALPRLTGTAGNAAALTHAQLADMDLGATFAVRGSSARPWKLKREPPLARVETLGGLLDRLPRPARLIARVHAEPSARIRDLVIRIAGALDRRGLTATTLLSSGSLQILDAARNVAPAIRRALVLELSEAHRGPPDSLVIEGLDALILPGPSLLDAAAALTSLAKSVQQAWNQGKLRDGAIVTVAGDRPHIIDWIQRLSALPFVTAITVPSTIDVADHLRKLRRLESESFSGEQERSARFHFGYAKANRFAHVYQSDGVHLDLAPYVEPPPVIPRRTGDPLEDRLTALEEAAWDAARDWPFYSGGGVGTAFPLDGDFIAEVSFAMERTTQATMCEMAATNVEPGRHIPGWKADASGKPLVGSDGKPIANRPESFRDKDSFFDPHGAPPFVGAEHDEDDGYRINYNLGVDYDNNHYGRPIGNGSTKQGRFRLERRGPYFSAYYTDTENPEWVVAGVCRNDSMNPQVFIRCAGKRWRQETMPPLLEQPYLPVVDNHIVFRNFAVWTILDAALPTSRSAGAPAEPEPPIPESVKV